MAATESGQSLSASCASYTNPVRWEDLPDPEVIRVNDVYYMSASSFHFSPGAPVLKSYNLVDWEYVGHSIPELPPRARFSLDDQRPVAYGKGVWASTLKYRQSDGLFYFYSPLQGTDNTYVSTAKDPSGPWTALPPVDKFYYDLGLLIDDDDTLYLAYGTKTIEVAQLSKDGLTETTSMAVHTSDKYLEGARMYKINGIYYIWVTTPGDAQWVLKSSGSPFGPYEARETIVEMRSPLVGAGPPHQGGLVDTPDGRWYYMAFTDAYPVGRIPILAPVIFDSEGWPKVVADYPDEHGQWQREYPCPHPQMANDTRTMEEHRSCIKRHVFDNSTLEHCWEWNHNPDNSRWSLQQGRMILGTGTITQSLHRATNTLTHRTIGLASIATFCIDVSNLKDGDRCGASLFRDECAYIGIHKEGGTASLVYVDGVKVGPVNLPIGWLNARPVALDWKWISNGSVEAKAPLERSRVWLRIKADLRPVYWGEDKEELRHATFEYSYDGVDFSQLGPAHTLTKSMAGFIGHRFGLFNFATEALGGELSVEHCDIELWNPQDAW